MMFGEAEVDLFEEEREPSKRGPSIAQWEREELKHVFFFFHQV